MFVSHLSTPRLICWPFPPSVPWAAVEPARGEYDHAYLAEMVAIVNRAGARGIYTVVDFHQDAWNAKFCGNGVPGECMYLFSVHFCASC